MWSGLALGSVLLAACGGNDDDATTTPSDDTPSTAAAEPVSIDNCGVEVTADGPPQRAVTMNQAATEIMLALGLEDRMVGTAYRDDKIPAEFADAYDEIPVLAEEYPSPETLLDTEPDLVYGAYPSAFEPENGGARTDLADLGIATYLSPSACPDKPDDELLTIETVWQEIQEIGAIFGVSDAAEELVDAQRDELAAAVDGSSDFSSTTVMWWDGGTDVPMVGVCCGAPGMIMDAAGVENAFADVHGSWADVSWEQVVERDPDVIVLIDADWSTAEEKRELIASIPAVQSLRAVEEERFVEIPFSAATPGVRNVSAVVEFIDGLEALQ